MRIGYVVGHTTDFEPNPEVDGEMFDGVKDAQRQAVKQNDKYPMLHHKVYELHELETA